MADKLYYVSSVNVRLKHSEQLMKCIHNKQGCEKKGSFSDNTAKRVVFTEVLNTLFRVLSSILCSSIGTYLGAKNHPH